MDQSGGFDFGAEVMRLMPHMLREVTRTQKSAIAKGNLAVSHIVVLDMLSAKKACTMGELARTMDLTMSAATGIIDKMIELGLVKRERSSSDRRVVRVMLLKRGSDLMRKVNVERRKMIDRMFTVLTDTEKHEYLRLFRKVIEGISAVPLVD